MPDSCPSVNVAECHVLIKVSPFFKEVYYFGGQALGVCEAPTHNFAHKRPNNNKVGLSQKHLLKVMDEWINTELSSTDAGSV